MTNPKTASMNYSRTSFADRRRIEQLKRAELGRLQLAAFNQLLAAILPTNQFYSKKLAGLIGPLESIERLRELPFTLKHELLGDPPAEDLESEATEGFAANLTFPPEAYARFHRTSGSRGRPMVVLDTREDWSWWMETWQYVLDTAEMTPDDRVLMAFGFGPFVGFWSAFDAAIERGAMVIPTGAMKTLERIELVRSMKATTLFCTPSYALHMAEVAQSHQLDMRRTAIRKVIVAGEPGGSLPSVRNRIESAWDADVVDHSGASEVGPWGYADPLGRGIYVNEAQFFAEFISIETGAAASEGELSELVLTTLGRVGCPVIRYRTGDLVRPTWSDDQPCNFALLEGGVLGRDDDMMIIRGVNIFPTSIEAIIRSFPEIAEFRLTAFKRASMDQLKVEVEDPLEQPQRIANELQVRLSLRVDVQCVPAGSLPRFEAKGKRFVDLREDDQLTSD